MNKHLLYLTLGFSLITGSIQAQTMQKVSKCIQENGMLKSVIVNYNTSTGDYTVTRNGEEVPFENAYPTDATYAANSNWYINNEPVTVKGSRYVKYGLPRILGTSDVIKFSDYRDVPVYAENGLKGQVEIIYIPVRPDCEFQPYQVEVAPAPAAKKKTKIKAKR